MSYRFVACVCSRCGIRKTIRSELIAMERCGERACGGSFMPFKRLEKMTALTPLQNPKIPDGVPKRYVCPHCGFDAPLIGGMATDVLRVEGRQGEFCPACFQKWVPRLVLRTI